MEWTSGEIEQLEALWLEGHSTAEIGRRMKKSTNAIVGKAHRTNLPGRPNPIRRSKILNDGLTLPVRRMPHHRVMSLASAHPPHAVIESESGTVKGGTREIVAPVPAKVALPWELGREERRCHWPIGNPGNEDFRFCSAEPHQRKPYCLAHMAVGYVTTTNRREDAS